MNESTLNHKHAMEIIRRFMKYLRMQRASCSTPPDAGYFYLPYRHNGTSIDLPLGFIGTCGCSWAQEGGCTICDYGGYARSSTPLEARKQLHRLFREWNFPRVVNLSALGSIFDQTEVSHDTRTVFFETLRQMPNLEYVGVESRSEFVTAEAVREALECLGPIKLDIGMGLESVDDTIRNIILNKSLDLNTYVNAVGILKDLHVLPVTHVFFKPPLLTERESIEDVKHTIRFACSVRSHRIVLMLSNIKEYTLTWWLMSRGQYRVPWLWSVLKALLDLEDECLEGLLVYGFECGVNMMDTARNCPICTTAIRGAIDEFNKTGRRSALLRAWKIKCTCRNEWEMELFSERQVAIDQRIQWLVSELESYLGNTGDFTTSGAIPRSKLCLTKTRS